MVNFCNIVVFTQPLTAIVLILIHAKIAIISGLGNVSFPDRLQDGTTWFMNMVAIVKLAFSQQFPHFRKVVAEFVLAYVR